MVRESYTERLKALFQQIDQYFERWSAQEPYGTAITSRWSHGEFRRVHRALEAERGAQGRLAPSEPPPADPLNSPLRPRPGSFPSVRSLSDSLSTSS